MDTLSHLPNIGKVLEHNLRLAGIETSEQLRDLGAEAAFIRIRIYADPGACLHMLYGIQGAIEGTPDKLLPDSTKLKLKAFYKTLERGNDDES